MDVVLFGLQGPSGHLLAWEELNLFRGDNVLIKGKKRKESGYDDFFCEVGAIDFSSKKAKKAKKSKKYKK